MSKKFLRKTDGRTYHFGLDGVLYSEGGNPAMQVQNGEKWEGVCEVTNLEGARKLKINDVFANLRQNPKEAYRMQDGGCTLELSINEVGYFELKVTDALGHVVNPSYPAGGFDGNIHMDREWTKVRKQVDFMTAANSEEAIRPMGNDVVSYSFAPIDYWLNRKLCLSYINGQWEIE
jgi:hypothetical protein